MILPGRDGRPDAAFVDIPEDAFPVTLRILDKATRREVWSATLEQPGGVLIPGKQDTNDGNPVTSRVEFANGRVEESED